MFRVWTVTRKCCKCGKMVGTMDKDYDKATRRLDENKQQCPKGGTHHLTGMYESEREWADEFLGNFVV